MRTVTITHKEYRELLKDSEWRLRMENGGVDNWEWYSESLNPEWAESFSDACEEIDEVYADE